MMINFISGDTVYYKPTGETGVVVRKNDEYVFVKYYDNDGFLKETPQATRAEDLGYVKITSCRRCKHEYEDKDDTLGDCIHCSGFSSYRAKTK